jgi:CRISPR/Cas system-associated endoribonuclease Cas2
MSLFVITYDLRKNRNYQTLYDELERLDAFRVLESVFLADLSNTAAEVRDHLESFIDGDDGILVVEFDKRPAAFKCNQGTKKWLEDHFG